MTFMGNRGKKPLVKRESKVKAKLSWCRRMMCLARNLELKKKTECVFSRSSAPFCINVAALAWEV